jgi:hypothetical protein
MGWFFRESLFEGIMLQKDRVKTPIDELNWLWILRFYM